MQRIAEENWNPETKPTTTADRARWMKIARRSLKLAKKIGDLETIEAIETYWPDLKE